MTPWQAAVQLLQITTLICAKRLVVMCVFAVVVVDGVDVELELELCFTISQMYKTPYCFALRLVSTSHCGVLADVNILCLLWLLLLHETSKAYSEKSPCEEDEINEKCLTWL